MRLSAMFLPLPGVNPQGGRAFFSNASSAFLPWNQTVGFDYIPMIGQPVITDGGVNVVVAADGTSQTPAGITINADSPFTGYVDGFVIPSSG